MQTLFRIVANSSQFIFYISYARIKLHYIHTSRASFKFNIVSLPRVEIILPRKYMFVDFQFLNIKVSEDTYWVYTPEVC